MKQRKMIKIVLSLISLMVSVDVKHRERKNQNYPVLNNPYRGGDSSVVRAPDS